MSDNIMRQFEKQEKDGTGSGRVHELVSDAPNPARDRIMRMMEERKRQNPDGLTCSSCMRFTRWYDEDGCNSMNQHYFCKKHTRLSR